VTIKDWMEADGLTARAAAELAQVNLRYMEHLVARRKTPSLEVARRLIEASRGRVTVHDLTPKVRSTAEDTRADAA